MYFLSHWLLFHLHVPEVGDEYINPAEMTVINPQEKKRLSWGFEPVAISYQVLRAAD